MATATGDTPDGRHLLLCRLPPGRGQTRLAAAVLAVLLAALLAAVPFARVPLSGSAALLPAYATAVLLNEAITATLLFTIYAIERSPALLALAAGYLFSALMIVPWALTFPGVFAPGGLFDPGLQGTAVIAAVRRLGFPLFILVYALVEESGPPAEGPRPAAWPVVGAAVAAVVATVSALTWLVVANDAALPRLMVDRETVAALWTSVPAGEIGRAACRERV